MPSAHIEISKFTSLLINIPPVKLHILETMHYYKMMSLDNSCNYFVGYYLYIETSPRFPGDKATILTPSLNGAQCMNFSYHMFGADIGSLNIFANNQRIFSKSGNQGNQWVSVQTPIFQSGIYKVSQRLKGEKFKGKNYFYHVELQHFSCIENHFGGEGSGRDRRVVLLHSCIGLQVSF